MGGSRKASVTLTGWLNAHFKLKTLRRRIAAPPIQPHSPISKTTRNSGTEQLGVVPFCAVASRLQLTRDGGASLSPFNAH